MYFKDKDNTNIDDEFNNSNNIISSVLNFINKYKIILVFLIVIILIIIVFTSFLNKKTTNFLVLNGEEIITIYEGTDYIEPGYIAYNSKDEDLNKDVKIDSNLDTKMIGEYEIIYTLGDIVKNRKVIVVEKPQIHTFIRLNAINNNINIYLKIGEEYKEPGYIVFSTTGENLNDKVKITGNIDTSKKGVYTLAYSLIDANGVTISTTRTITVMDTEISLSLSNTEYTNQDISINIMVLDSYFDYMILPDGSKITENNYSYKVSTNGKYTFKTYNKKGVIKEESKEVNNIDKTPPTGSCNGSYKNGKSTINVNAKDNIGIKQYEINRVLYAKEQITIDKELTNVTIKIYDKAGNTNDISCSLKNNNTPSSSKPSSSSSSSKPSSSKPSSSSSSSKPSSSKPSSSSSSSKPSSSSSVSSGTIQNTKNISSNAYKNFRYWLYLPDKVTENLPIIVYLPSLGETGIGSGPINEIKNHGQSYNAIIVHMTVPSGSSVNKHLSDYISLINELVNKYSANKNKVSIMGFSNGCYGLVNMIEKYPNYFSAAVFVGCAPNKRIDINKYINQPIWTFVGGGDGEKDSTDQYGNHYSLANFVNKINEAGGNAKATSVKSKWDAHNILNSNYSILRDSDYNVINWMISKTKK